MTTPLADDPVWNELPEGVVTICDGDEVVGLAFPREAEGMPDLDEMNVFLAKTGMPLLDPHRR